MVVGICVALLVVVVRGTGLCGCRRGLLVLLLGGEGLHVVVLCVCAQANQREQHEGNNICFHCPILLILGANLRTFIELAKGKSLF